MKKLYLFYCFFLLGCSLKDFSDFISDDDILYLSSYENVKIVPQDSDSSGLNIHPIKIPAQKLKVD